MKNILHITSSLNGENSYSIKLGNAIIEKIKETHPGSRVKVRNLAEDQFPHLKRELLNVFFIPGEERTPAQMEMIRHSDKVVREIFEADIIVIGAPMYNFGIPSLLKAWIDHIARAGVTFRYTENGPEGLVKGKKVYIAMASGGIYSRGTAQPLDFVSPYLKGVLGFMGMTDVELVRAEGTAMITTKANAIEKALDVVAV